MTAIKKAIVLDDMGFVSELNDANPVIRNILTPDACFHGTTPGLMMQICREIATPSNVAFATDTMGDISP